MKEILKMLRNWMIFWLWIILALSIWVIWVFAWQSISYTAGTWNLTAESGDTLTLAKWNELVSRVRWVFTDSTWKVWIWKENPTTALDVNGTIKATSYEWITFPVETDSTVISSVKDWVSWWELWWVPAWFSDGVDNVWVSRWDLWIKVYQCPAIAPHSRCTSSSCVWQISTSQTCYYDTYGGEWCTMGSSACTYKWYMLIDTTTP